MYPLYTKITSISSGKLWQEKSKSFLCHGDRIKYRAKESFIAVRDLEKQVRKYLNPEKYAKAKTEAQSVELRGLILDMQHVFATKVRAIGNDTKGRIYIDYYTRDDLDRLREFVDALSKLNIK